MKLRYVLIIIVLVVGMYFALNYFSGGKIISSPGASHGYLTADYFGDESEFRGLTLPFPEGTNYSVSWNVNLPLTADLVVESGTEVLAAAPGVMKDTTGYSNYFEIRVDSVENVTLVYTIGGNRTTSINRDPKIGRGDAINFAGNSLDGSKTTLRIQATGIGIDKGNFWASGEPKYFRP